MFLLKLPPILGCLIAPGECGRPPTSVVGPADIVTLAGRLMANTALTGATHDIEGGQQLVAKGA